MDSKKIEILLEKYWVGETTLEEEREIKTYLGKREESRFNTEEMSYFALMESYQRSALTPKFEEEILHQILRKKKGFRMTNWLKIAASIVLLLGATLFIYYQYQNRTIRQAELAEAREAFELTKQALFLVSSELNRGATFAKELDKFDITVERIKNHEVSIELHN